ncbi:MAG: PilN domain-containing protein [Planctomycetota bacterium]
MIKINLLPPELQRAAKTPKSLFFALIGGVMATMLVGVGVLLLWISVRSLERTVESRQIQVRALQDEAREVDRLNEDIALYKDREQAIIEIKSRRTFWGLKLHQLMQLTPEDIWVTRLSLNTFDEADYKWEKGKQQSGGTLQLHCYALGTEVQTLTNYRASLAGRQDFYANLISDDSAFPDNFFGDFLGYAPPDLQRIQLNGYQEPRCLFSAVDINLKPRFEAPVPKDAKDGKDAKPAAKAEKKKG